MNQASFVAVGAPRILAECAPVAEKAVRSVVLEQLCAAGYAHEDVVILPVLSANSTFAGFLDVAVSDEALGAFMVRLHLLVDWNEGTRLVLHAIRAKEGTVLKDGFGHGSHLLARAVVAELKLDWAGLSVTAAVAQVKEWLREATADVPESALHKQWLALMSQVDVALAP